MTYKVLLGIFGLVTLGFIAFLGNNLMLARNGYFREFTANPAKRSRRRKKQGDTEKAERPFFITWWLRNYALSLSAGCGTYLLIAAGVYLVSPLLHTGAKTGRATAALPVESEQKKQLWKNYVELSLIAEKSPQDPILQLKLARMQRGLGLAKKALATYHKVIYLDPLSPDAQYEMGALAATVGEVNLAVSQVAELTRRWPRRPESFLLQASIDLRGGKQDEALTGLRRALALAPDNRETRNLLITQLLQQRAYAEACRLAEEGLKQTPAMMNQSVNATLDQSPAEKKPVADLYLLLAKSRIGLGEYAKAETALQGAAAATPSSATPFILRGDLRMSRGNFQDALASYEEALQRDPDNSVVMNNIASLSVEHGFDLARAATLAARMYAKYPRDPAVADTLGWVLHNQGKRNEALPLLQFAATGSPDNPVHRYHYGAALVKNGQTAAGRKELEAALKLSRGFDGAGRAQTLLKEMKN
jgi:cellulose synthase operon protein C